MAELAGFDDAQIGEWLGRWRRVNGGGPAVAEALAHEQLTRQPLLLLAIYRAEPGRPAETASPALNDLYRHLFNRGR